MVDASELPFRILVRRYGAQLCYTPMIHAKQFLGLPSYKQVVFTTAEGSTVDRPLIAQFCGNDPDTVITAAKQIQHLVDAVDLNLGCPQRIAQRGFYGSFLMNDLPLVEQLVTSMVQQLDVPVTCKIRVFPIDDETPSPKGEETKSFSKEDYDQMTIEYAKMLERCGIQMLVVHPRTRKLVKGHFAAAEMAVIKQIRKELTIPVLANGNLEYFDDTETVLEESDALGVMAAEGLLSNPRLFCQDSDPRIDAPCDLVLEYLQIAEEYPTSIGIMRGHCLRFLFKFVFVHEELRERLASAQDIPEIRVVVEELRTMILNCANPDEVYLEKHSWYRRHRRRMDEIAKKAEVEMKKLRAEDNENVEEGETMGCVFTLLDDE
jgi:tRNA-dihydrouridine synthase 1